ncbi:MAG: restriction endonuclease [Rhodoferax sp.]
MKLKMSENSLFAILLRSRWWISLLVVAAIVLLSGALLPGPYVPFGVVGALPFLVIALLAAWRQRHAPDPARVAAMLAQAASMSWRDFAALVEAAFQRQGYAVTRLEQPGADFQLLKGAKTTLVSAKRWKAANTGVQPLLALSSAQTALGANGSTFISLAPVSDSAQRLAKAQGVHLMSLAELAQLLGP